VTDASPAAITLALLLNEELGWTRWRRALELEKSRGADDRVDRMSHVLPANAAAPGILRLPAGDRPSGLFPSGRFHFEPHAPPGVGIDQ
jgi:hypothetical protein